MSIRSYLAGENPAAGGDSILSRMGFQPGMPRVKNFLRDRSAALIGMGLPMMFARTQRQGFEGMMAGLQSGRQTDFARSEQRRQDEVRQQREQALATVMASLQGQGKLPAGMEGLAVLPEIAAPLVANALKPPDPVNYGFTEVGGTLYRTNPREGSIDPLISAPQQPDYGFTEVDGNLIRTDKRGGTAEPVYQSPNAGKPNANEQFDNEAKLRDGYVKASNVFVDQRRAFSRIQASIGDNTGASDVALVFSFMRLLDPSSTVREGEFATAEQTGGLPAQIVNMYNRLVDGQRLTPDQRQNFLQQAQRQYAAAEAQQTELDNTYRGLAEQYGFEPGRIVIDVRGGVKAGDPASGAVQAARDAIARGADREAVRQRLIENGIQPPSDL